MVSTDKTLQCVVVTPERAVLDEPVDFVALTMYDGELGVLPGRAPLIGRLGYGELRIRHGQSVRRFFIDGGFTQIRSNVVTVLTPRAVRAEEIDTAAAQAALQEPAPAVKTPEAMETFDKSKERARAQLRAARHAGH